MTLLLVTAPAWLALLAAAACLFAESVGAPRVGVTLAWVGLLIASLSAIWLAVLAPVAVGGLLVVTRALPVVAAVMLAAAAGAVVVTTGAPDIDAHQSRTAALIAGAAGAAVAAMPTRDLLAVVVALETMALAGYAIVAAGRSRASATASTTYFVQGAVAAGMLMFGAGAAIVMTGTTDVSQIAVAMKSMSRLALAGPVIAMSGLLALAVVFKAGAFPMHSWVPDAYEASDPGPAAFLASVPKTAALVVLASLAGVLFGGGALLGTVVALLAAASMVYGSLAGLRQTDYQRLLGYSAITQAGFAITGLTASWSATVLMALVYAVATLGAFAAAEAVRRTVPAWDGSIAGMAGLSKKRPVLAVALAVCLFSLTGIPPLAGFWGKYAVLTAAFVSGRLWLVILGGLASVIAFGYYGRVLRAVWLDPAVETAPSDEEPQVQAEVEGSALPATLVVLAAATLVVVTGLLPLVGGLGVFNSLLR